MNLEFKNGQIEILLENSQEIDAFGDIIVLAYDKLDDEKSEPIEMARQIWDFFLEL